MNTMVVLLVLALEGSYYDSVSQGSCTRGKEIVLCQIKVSAFVNFEVDRLKMMMMMMNRRFCNFPCILVAAHFTSFEGLTIYRNTGRACCGFKKACIAFKSSGLLDLLGLKGRVGAIPT